MTTPEEYEASRKRYAWKLVRQLDVLHSELASLYRSQFQDPRRQEIVWSAIEDYEQQLNEIGFSYEQYAASNK